VKGLAHGSGKAGSKGTLNTTVPSSSLLHQQVPLHYAQPADFAPPGGTEMQTSPAGHLADFSACIAQLRSYRHGRGAWSASQIRPWVDCVRNDAALDCAGAYVRAKVSTKLVQKMPSAGEDGGHGGVRGLDVGHHSPFAQKCGTTQRPCAE